ncbi:MAG: hypothetical protein A2Z21_05245 [Candidatus Fraserbacteria bacterium RBG_16_55_9]|uniref:Outer membrane protein beta-barrel domain-containing protein n=1 Tax=Fraserbacteria sp. (strain RBG_16_55_9) TaxID=1817864 RepID=A0A1F5US83_FRAXR|nr:MAG: hypothetical protein A2Z21_05245 [Candidatus Fraserbacteria bacterium RBG_16_55_9]
MTIRKVFSLLSLTLIAVMIAIPVRAVSLSSLEVGVKVPLAGLAAIRLNDQLRLEVSAAFPGFSAPLVDFEGMLAAKLYPGPMQLGDLTMEPFVGGGALFIFAVGQTVPGLVVLAGMENTHPELPLTLFAEGSGALLMSGSAPTLAFQLSLGARYEFGP